MPHITTLTPQVPPRFGKFAPETLAVATVNAACSRHTQEGKQLQSILNETDRDKRDYALIQALKQLDFQAVKGRRSEKLLYRAAVQKYCQHLQSLVAKMWAKDILEKSEFQYSATTQTYLNQALEGTSKSPVSRPRQYA